MAYDSVSVGEPSPASAVSAAAPGRSAVTLAAPIVALLLIILSLTPSLGGYGLILWALHPIGLILAVCLLLPLSFGAALGDVARLTSLDSLAKRAFPRAGARELRQLQLELVLVDRQDAALALASELADFHQAQLATQRARSCRYSVYYLLY